MGFNAFGPRVVGSLKKETGGAAEVGVSILLQLGVDIAKRVTWYVVRYDMLKV